jgi:hypothetical protein
VTPLTVSRIRGGGGGEGVSSTAATETEKKVVAEPRGCRAEGVQMVARRRRPLSSYCLGLLEADAGEEF